MTSYLLDTNIASVLGPDRRLASPSDDVLDWLIGHAHGTYLSVVTVMEIESGIRQLALKGSTRKSAKYADWLSGLMDTFGKRILPVENHVAMTTGRLEALALAKGRHPGLADLMIAATADVHRLTVLTRNLRHFEPLEVSALDPFKSRPGSP